MSVKYSPVCIGPLRIEGNIIGEMENLETDLVRAEQSGVRSPRSYNQQACQDVLTIRTKIENSTNKMKNGLRTLAILYPNNLL